MKTSGFRSNFGIETPSSTSTEIVVAGGYDGRSTIDLCEAYDWRRNAWHQLPKMSLRRSALYLFRLENCDDLIDQMLNGRDTGAVEDRL